MNGHILKINTISVGELTKKTFLQVFYYMGNIVDAVNVEEEKVNLQQQVDTNKDMAFMFPNIGWATEAKAILLENKTIGDWTIVDIEVVEVNRTTITV